MAKTNTDILKQINKGKINRTAKRQERKRNPAKYAPIHTGNKSTSYGNVKTCWLNAITWDGKVFAEHQLMTYDPTIDAWVSEDRMLSLHNDDIVFEKTFEHGIHEAYFIVSKSKIFMKGAMATLGIMHKLLYGMIPEGRRMQFQSEETFKKTKHKTIKG